MDHPPVGRLRCLLVWAVATTAALALGRLLLADLSAGLSAGVPTDVEAALSAWCEAVLLACLAWAWLATSAVVVELLVHRAGVPGAPRAGGPGVPLAWRRLVLAACGVALSAGMATGLAAPAHATPGGLHLDPDGRRTDPVAVRLAGLPMPDRAVDARHRPRPAAPVDDRVVVRAGDTLWSIAAADLGPGASTRAVADRWHQIYAANRAQLGVDPDVIVVGQRLDLPA